VKNGVDGACIVQEESAVNEDGAGEVGTVEVGTVEGGDAELNT